MSQQAGLTVETLLARTEISDVVHRYATGIDRRDWPLFRSCFADEIDLDFTTWSGGEPRRMKGDDWVEGVRNSLSGFDATQHVSSNHVHTIEGSEATCVSYMMALHHIVDGADRLHLALGAVDDVVQRHHVGHAGRLRPLDRVHVVAAYVLGRVEARQRVADALDPVVALHPPRLAAAPGGEVQVDLLGEA